MCAYSMLRPGGGEEPKNDERFFFVSFRGTRSTDCSFRPFKTAKNNRNDNAIIGPCTIDERNYAASVTSVIVAVDSSVWYACFLYATGGEPLLYSLRLANALTSLSILLYYH